MKAGDYRERFYRAWAQAKDLYTFRISCGETDLQISALPPGRLGETWTLKLENTAQELVRKYRTQILKTIKRFPEFLTSLQPLALHTEFEITDRMLEMSSLAGVGPMAAVAGAIAEFVGHDLLSIADEIIVENGGDLFIRSMRERAVLIYAGEDSPYKNKLLLRVRGRDLPLGIASSSGRIGHSLSLGNTDVALITACSAITADAFATAIGNLVKHADDIPQAMEFAARCKEIEGGLILIGSKLGIWGEIELLE